MSQEPENAHVTVGHKNECKTRNDITAPVKKQQVEISQDDKKDSDVVAEAIFAGKKVKEFALDNHAAFLASRNAEFSRLSKNFFVRDCPGDAGDGNGKNEKPGKLCDNVH